MRITDIYQYASRFEGYRKDFHSYGLYCLTTEMQIRNKTVTVQNTPDRMALLKDTHTGKWCIIDDTYQSDHIRTMMLGAVCGNVIGGIYHNNPNKYYPTKNELVRNKAHFYSASVLTCAVAMGISDAVFQLADRKMTTPEYEHIFHESVIGRLVTLTQQYANMGYGENFLQWAYAPVHQPYYSWGNGSAMRVSYAGWVAKSLEEAQRFARLSAEVTHNHYEGIKGAMVVAGCIYILRSGGSKDDIINYVKWFYNINFTIDKIRPFYQFSHSCQDCVPQAIVCFLEGEDFADVIAKAISLGGDSTSICAIAGSIAETAYPIPYELRKMTVNTLDSYLREKLIEATDFCVRLYEGEKS